MKTIQLIFSIVIVVSLVIAVVFSNTIFSAIMFSITTLLYLDFKGIFKPIKRWWKRGVQNAKERKIKLQIIDKMIKDGHVFTELIGE